MKKEHHLTKAKRLREEVESSAPVEQVAPETIVELEKKVEKLEKALSRPYYVYDSRASVVAYSNSEEEANEVLKGFPGGFKKLI